MNQIRRQHPFFQRFLTFRNLSLKIFFNHQSRLPVLHTLHPHPAFSIYTAIAIFGCSRGANPKTRYDLLRVDSVKFPVFRTLQIAN
jgi:hypothetical protein